MDDNQHDLNNLGDEEDTTPTNTETDEDVLGDPGNPDKDLRVIDEDQIESNTGEQPEDDVPPGNVHPDAPAGNRPPDGM
jgi:hypothetical protein